jgi:hypothetical protein
MVHSGFLRRMKSFCLLLLFACITEVSNAQSPFKGFEPLFTTPKNYIVCYTNHPPVIDGNINELVWQQAKWTDEFVDIEGDSKPKPAYPTRVKMLWDDSCLYIAAEITDPNVWATLKHHDDIVFRDNDFEVFVDPVNAGRPYFEIEVNALNTIFDLLLPKPYRDGGSAVINWNVQDFRSATKIQGTLNDPSDTDKGWTVEMAIPFKSISVGNQVRVPNEGSVWRINFSRVEWDTKVENGKYVKLTNNAGRPLPEHNWVWSPQGVIDMHFPERWGYLLFTKADSDTPAFKIPYAELQKQYLWLLYYRQKEWFQKHQEYNMNITGLGIDTTATIGKKVNKLYLEATKHQFMAFIKDKDDKFAWAINQDGLVSQLNTQPDE